MKTWASNAIRKFGLKAQLGMLQEECAELIVAVSKFERALASTSNPRWLTELDKTKDSLAEELADVEIMIEQIRGHFFSKKGHDLVKKFKQSKIKKLVFMIRRK